MESGEGQTKEKSANGKIENRVGFSHPSPGGIYIRCLINETSR